MWLVVCMSICVTPAKTQIIALVEINVVHYFMRNCDLGYWCGFHFIISLRSYKVISYNGPVSQCSVLGWKLTVTKECFFHRKSAKRFAVWIIANQFLFQARL